MARVLIVDGKRYNADWAGRKIIVASYLYYMLDTPVMSDAQYDRMSAFVADYWDQLDWERQWNMRTAEETRSSGAHFRFTNLPAYAALNQYKYITGIVLRFHPKMVWRERKRDGCQYITLSSPRPVRLSPDTVRLQSAGRPHGPQS